MSYIRYSNIVRTYETLLTYDLRIGNTDPRFHFVMRNIFRSHLKNAVFCKQEHTEFSHFEHSVFVKLDKNSFHSERDLIIGAVYLSPETSAIYKGGKTGIDLLVEKNAQILSTAKLLT